MSANSVTDTVAEINQCVVLVNLSFQYYSKVHCTDMALSLIVLRSRS